MPPPFQSLEMREFIRLLGRFPLERTLAGVHLHHTWRPRGADWHGQDSMQALYWLHTLQHGWSDIAFHLAVDPKGVLWTGRDWNRPPCSAPGQNGDRCEGPFMVMLVGDFNRGGEPLPAVQAAQALEAIARVQRAAKLDADTVAFHSDFSSARGISCPGQTFSRNAFVDDLKRTRAALSDPKSPPTPTTPPFGEDAEAWFEFITLCAQNRDLKDEPANEPIELDEIAMEARA